MKLSELILSRFRGRADHIAVGQDDGSFAPAAGRITPMRLECEHLAQGRCLGLYVMTEDAKCHCTCVDFDNKPEHPNPKWKEQAEQTYYALLECQLTPLMELSQSGRGAHVWLFFGEATPAWVARAWWRAVAQKIGVEFREVFPKQDQHTGKGLGNLVRYPLWNASQFVDVENGWAALDPVAALSAVRTIAAADLTLLAFQLGMGDLKPEQKAAVQAVMTDDGAALLPTRVAKLLERKWSHLARRWGGDTSGMKDPSKSALAMAVTVELVRLYVPTPEIVSALRYWCVQNGAEVKAARDAWVSLTVTKAYDFIVTREEAKSAESTMTMQDASGLYLDQLTSGKPMHQGSGIAPLDESIDGVAASEIVVVAARPGHGKSALGLQWLDHAAYEGMPGLIISEEMAAAQLGKRHLQSVSSLPEEHWGPECVTELRDELGRYHEKRAPVYVVENCNTVDRAEDVIDQFCRIHGVGIVAVDYLQLLTTRGEGRYEIVTEISRRLAQCAKRNSVRMLLMCQLNRQVEARQDNEPRMSDLRESGQIEQDADLIIFPQWPWKFDPNMPESAYRIYVAKRRNGAIRSPKIETTFDGARQLIGFGVQAKPQDVFGHAQPPQRKPTRRKAASPFSPIGGAS